MKILITNDDGIHSFGIIEMARRLQRKNEVFVVAPRTEQSGISQAITFLRPLFPVKLGSPAESEDGLTGFSLDGTPADCVKLALSELCPFEPELIVSGINGGLNAGVNVCYSGTVGAALVGATFNIPSIAISLEFEAHMQFDRAADVVMPIVEQFDMVDWPNRTVLNINIPTSALRGIPEVAIVPVETNPLGYAFDRGVDPKGRHYFWSNNKPDAQPSPFETDVQALKMGKITVSPITFDLNAHDALQRIQRAAISPVDSKVTNKQQNLQM
jgi:5'-nucleotidase